MYREPRKTPFRGRDAIAAEFARFAASGVAFRLIVEGVIDGAADACVAYRFAVRDDGGEGRGDAWRERAGCAIVRFDERGQIAEWREYEG